MNKLERTDAPSAEVLAKLDRALPLTPPPMRGGIIDRQRQGREIGIIRLGFKDAKGPKALTKFRLTSLDRTALEAASKLYGGTVRPWEQGGFELFTEAEEIDVFIAPVPLSEYYELWTRGGIQRRCNGQCQIEKFAGKPCLCPSDIQERLAAAKKGQACSAIMRMSVVLRKLPGVGYWRVNTQSYFAQIELPLAAGNLQALAMRGINVPARLANPMRVRAVDGQTRRYTVPELRIDLTPEDVSALSSGAQMAITAGEDIDPPFSDNYADDDAGTMIAEAHDFTDDGDEPAVPEAVERIAAPAPVIEFLYNECKFTEEQVLDLRAYCNDQMVDFDDVILKCKQAKKKSFDMIQLCARNTRKAIDVLAAKAVDGE